MEEGPHDLGPNVNKIYFQALLEPEEVAYLERGLADKLVRIRLSN